MIDTWQRWPKTYAACIATYFKAEKFGKPGEVPADGNYMLAGLKRFSEAFQSLHGHRNVGQWALDAAAAHEILYVFNRSRKFTRPAAALSACITNLVTERPERILDRHDARLKKQTAKSPS